MTFDKSEYERQQNLDMRRASDTLLGHSGFADQLDDFDNAPVVMLRCPRGHKLLPVRAVRQDNVLRVEALPGQHARSSTTVTYHAEPWAASKRVCLASGCPTLVEQAGFCSQHGGPLEELGGLRTGFRCRIASHRWTVPITNAELLRRYGLAVILRHDELTFPS